MSGGPADLPPSGELFAELLRRTHLSSPADLPEVIADVARVVGVRELHLHLVDHDQDELVPLRASGDDGRAPLSIAGTVAGRAFSTSSIVESPVHGGQERRLWFPLLDGTERVGVMGVVLPPGDVSEDLVALLERYAHLSAMLVVTKGAYTDLYEIARRRRPMTIASELVWSLAPPVVFATDRLVVAGMLEPAHDNGGDAFDYAVDGRVLHLAVLDAMGRGLPAAGVAAFAVAAYRHSRRNGHDLAETYRSMDAAVAGQFPDDRFVTALIARLEIATGELTWVSAGHPPPLVLRGGRRVRTLTAPPALPLGLGDAGRPPRLGQESLEPSDLLLLYTDGLPEARGQDGRRFEIDGLSEFIEREAAAGHAAPETLRRLRHAIVAHHDGELEDDATAVLVEWRRGSERSIVPDEVGAGP